MRCWMSTRIYKFVPVPSFPSLLLVLDCFSFTKLTNLILLLSFIPPGGINVCWYRLQYFAVWLLVCLVKKHMLDLPTPVYVDID